MVFLDPVVPMRITLNKNNGLQRGYVALFLLLSGPVFSDPKSTQSMVQKQMLDRSKSSNQSEAQWMAFLLRCMKIIQKYYVDPIDQEALIHGAIRGMCYAADPHSFFFSEKECARLEEQYKGAFGGIGVVMNVDRLGRMQIVSCLDYSPAATAGILSGDVIIAVDDVVLGQFEGISKVSERMRGKPGTIVKLTIERKGQTRRLSFKIKRTNIISGLSVKHHISNGVAIIRMASFDGQTPDLLKKAILDIQKTLKNELKGYVIDLRRNSGGMFDSAVQCCQLFIDKGVLVRSKGRPEIPEEVTYAVPGLALVHHPTPPVVIVIDEGTASAAEIMVGALQDYKKAIVLGVSSYGKGSTQEVIPLDGHSGAIKLTISRWYTPLTRRPIQGHGIVPDIVTEQMPWTPAVQKPDLVIRERNVSGTLRPKALNTDPAQSAASLDDPNQTPSSSNEQKPEPPYDHQMTRAIELVSTIHLLGQGQFFTARKQSAPSTIHPHHVNGRLDNGVVEKPQREKPASPQSMKKTESTQAESLQSMTKPASPQSMKKGTD
ncbi:MAG: S41 family peptidase [Alphaproteobacteria bacterium]|nr:S41 family peptidase [Alphaproteobacteria bacterium]